MEQDQMVKVVIDRANEMLKDENINALYQNHKTKNKAQEWLIKMALATLIVSVEDRKK